MDEEVVVEPVNGEHITVEDVTDAPLRSPPQTAPKPPRESRGSMVFSKFITCRSTSKLFFRDHCHQDL